MPKRKTKSFNVSDEILYYNLLNLIGAIFRLAAQDMKYGNKEDVLEFLESDWFECICEGMDLESDRVKVLIISGEVLQRMEYHT